MADETRSVIQVAAWLGISRQAVSRLRKNSARTGFPQPPWTEPQVREWYLGFKPGGGPRRGIKATTSAE